jgi:hypothetical protein
MVPCEDSISGNISDPISDRGQVDALPNTLGMARRQTRESRILQLGKKLQESAYKKIQM